MSSSQAQTPLAADTAQFSTTDVMRFSGATFRRLDHWCRIGALVPTVNARGSGSRRRYTAHEARCAWVIRVAQDLADATSRGGRSITMVADAVRHLDPWGGTLVIGSGAPLVVEHALALLDALAELGPAAVVIDLDACPNPLAQEAAA